MPFPAVTTPHRGPVRPLCVAAFSFAAAMAAARYLLPYGGASWAVLAAVVCSLVLLCLKRFLKYKNSLKTAALAILALAVGFGWRWGYDRLFVAPSFAWDGQTVAAQAEALDFARDTAFGVRLPARLTLPDGRRIHTTLYLNEALAIRPGDRLSLKVKCQAPIPGAADDTLTYDRPRGAVLRAVPAGGHVTLDRPEHVPFTLWPALIAEQARLRLADALPPANAALAQGFLIGETSGIGEGFRVALGDTGMAHTVAVSGLHVSFLVGLLLLLAGNRRRAFWLGLPVILLFVAVAGFPASAARSGIMQLTLLLSYVLGRDEDSLTALSLSLLAIVAWNPYAIADVGLQLSFASTLGIILFAGRFNQALESCFFWPHRPGASRPPSTGGGSVLYRLLRYVFSTLAVSLSALILSAPFLAVYFNTLSVISPLANLLSLWLVSFLFLGSLLLVGVSLIWAPLALGVGFVLAPGLSLFQGIITVLSRVPYAALKLTSPYFALWGLLVYILFWLYLMWPKQEGEKRRLRLPMGVGLATLALSIALSWVRPAPLEIIALNVGQGQCVLVLTPSQTAVLDCGGNIAHVARLAADTLKSMGRRRIDLLALTHCHADHAGAVEDLLAQIEVAQIALPSAESGGVSLRQDLQFLARRNGIPVSEISEMTEYPMDDAGIALYPPLGLQDENEMSMAILVHIGAFEMLVTGDMSASMERTLARMEELPDIEVLIAGHHGSKYATSNQLLDAAALETAIISVGRNSYGHPADETLERLLTRGIDVYRTDERGTVRIFVSP